MKNEGRIKKIRQIVNEAWEKLKAFASEHESKIYLGMTVLAIIYGFISNNYYRSELICKYEKE